MMVGCDIDPVNSESEIACSDIKPDENVIFFRTTAWLDETNQEWHVPIHGWIYENEDSAARKALFATILKSEYNLAPDAQTDANFTRRFNLLIADNERGKHIVVRVAGRRYVMPPSSENGQFEKTLIIPEAEIEKYAERALLNYSLVTQKNETRTFAGEILLVKPTGLSIISDIDDTVKISNVTDRKRLLENTFFLDFSAVPGMAQLYKEWSEHDVSLHFVSSSPWQLYPALEEFLGTSNFPRASFSLKAVRFRDETLLELFKKGTETKPVAIKKLLRAYPGRKFVLVGDSGEQDPEVYTKLMREHPEQVLGVYIRNVTEESADSQRFESLFRNIQENRWQLFDDPRTLTLPE
jgi:phosphatidate phosphatase APP1